MKKALLLSIIITIILFIVSSFVTNTLFANIGGYNAIYLPLPVKTTSCGSSPEAYINCTYPIIWWGIIANIILWIVVFIMSYRLLKD